MSFSPTNLSSVYDSSYLRPVSILTVVESIPAKLIPLALTHMQMKTNGATCEGSFAIARRTVPDGAWLKVSSRLVLFRIVLRRGLSYRFLVTIFEPRSFVPFGNVSAPEQRYCKGHEQDRHGGRYRHWVPS